VLTRKGLSFTHQAHGWGQLQWEVVRAEKAQVGQELWEGWLQCRADLGMAQQEAAGRMWDGKGSHKTSGGWICKGLQLTSFVFVLDSSRPPLTS
jgi:hypothetical protein